MFNNWLNCRIPHHRKYRHECMLRSFSMVLCCLYILQWSNITCVLTKLQQAAYNYEFIWQTTKCLLHAAPWQFWAFSKTCSYLPISWTLGRQLCKLHRHWTINYAWLQCVYHQRTVNTPICQQVSVVKWISWWPWNHKVVGSNLCGAKEFFSIGQLCSYISHHRTVFTWISQQHSLMKCIHGFVIYERMKSMDIYIYF